MRAANGAIAIPARKFRRFIVFAMLTMIAEESDGRQFRQNSALSIETVQKIPEDMERRLDKINS
jgi:hypothetical protein